MQVAVSGLGLLFAVSVKLVVGCIYRTACIADRFESEKFVTIEAFYGIYALFITSCYSWWLTFSLPLPLSHLHAT